MIALALLAAVPEPVLLDRALAIADGRAVTASSLAERSLQEVIDGVLIEAEADRLALAAEASDIDRALDDICARNQLTREELEAAALKQGYTMAVYRDRLRTQLRELKWLNLKSDRDKRPKNEGDWAEWYAAEKERLVKELRSAAIIELRDELPFAASGPTDGGCPERVTKWSASDGGLAGRSIARVCVLGAPEELRGPLTAVFAHRAEGPLSLEAAADDVESLIGSGAMRDARVLAVPLDGKRVTLLYAVQLWEPVVDIAVTGNAGRSTADLTRDLERGTRLGPGEAAQHARSLEKGYRELGWADAKVASRLEPADGGSRLQLDIREGVRVIVAVLKFKGQKLLSTAELERTVHTRVGGPHTPELAERDEAALMVLLAERGLLGGHIGAPVVKRTDCGFEVTYPITEGPVHKVRKVTLKGWPAGREAELLPKLETRTGKPFSRSSVKGDVDRIVFQAHQRGLEVSAAHELQVDTKAKVVDVTFELTPAPKGGIEF